MTVLTREEYKEIKEMIDNRIELNNKIENIKRETREIMIKIADRKKKAVKEKVLFFIVGAFIVLTTVFAIVQLGSNDNEAYNKCIEKGHNNTYCSVVFE